MIPIEHQLSSGAAYLALFAGTVFEGETVLFSAGFAAQQGYLSLPMVVFTAWLGAISGDHFSSPSAGIEADRYSWRGPQCPPGSEKYGHCWNATGQP